MIGRIKYCLFQLLKCSSILQINKCIHKYRAGERERERERESERERENLFHLEVFHKCEQVVVHALGMLQYLIDL